MKFVKKILDVLASPDGQAHHFLHLSALPPMLIAMNAWTELRRLNRAAEAYSMFPLPEFYCNMTRDMLAASNEKPESS